MDVVLRKSGKSARGLRSQYASLLVVGLSVVPASQFLFYLLYYSIATPCTDPNSKARLFSDLVFEIGFFCESPVAKFLLQTAHFAAMAISLCLGKYVTDRFGCKNVLVVAGAAAGIFNLLLAIMPFYWTFFTLKTLLGLVSGLVLSAAVRLFLAWTYRKYHAFSFHNLLGIEVLSTLSASMCIFFAVNWRFTLVANGLLSGIAAVLANLYVRETPKFLRKRERFDKAERFRRELAEANGISTIPLMETEHRDTRSSFSVVSVLYIVSVALVSLVHFTVQHFPTYYGMAWPAELLLLTVCQLMAYLVTLPFIAFDLGVPYRKAANVVSGSVAAALLLAIVFWTRHGVVVVLVKFFVCLVHLLSHSQITNGSHSDQFVLISLAASSASRTLGVWLVVQVVAYRRAICIFGVASFAFQSIVAVLWPSKTESRDDGAVDTGSPTTELPTAASSKTIDIDAASNLSVDLHI